MSNMRDFFLQLETSLKSGISLVKALGLIAENISGWGMSAKIRKVVANIEGGMTFSDAVEQVGSPFTTMQISFIRFGEETGTLDSVCASLAEYADREIGLERQVFSSMVYPLFLLLIAVIAGPMVKAILEQQKWQAGVIPAFQGVGIYFGVLTVLYVLYRIISATSASAILIYVPFFGQILQKLSLCRFTRTLSVGLEAGVPMRQAIETAIKVTTNPWLETQLRPLEHALAEGSSVGEAIAGLSIMPGNMKEMIKIGESSGKLPEMLRKTSDYFEEDAKHRIGIVTKLLPVVFFLPVALYMAWMLVNLGTSVYSSALSD